jgi:hypothetical protein
MRPKVYIETTIVSYLTAWPSRDLIRAAHQQLTKEWWSRRERFELYVSEAVLNEAADGDPTAAAERLVALQGVTVLEAGEEAGDLAQRLLGDRALPAKAAVDAVHIAIAAVNGMKYLLTWNCKHIANAVTRDTIAESCRRAGWTAPTICTPEELDELDEDEHGS